MNFFTGLKPMIISHGPNDWGIITPRGLPLTVIDKLRMKEGWCPAAEAAVPVTARSTVTVPGGEELG